MASLSGVASGVASVASRRIISICGGGVAWDHRRNSIVWRHGNDIAARSSAAWQAINHINGA